jgi:hypothetical protein
MIFSSFSPRVPSWPLVIKPVRSCVLIAQSSSSQRMTLRDARAWSTDYFSNHFFFALGCEFDRRARYTRGLQSYLLACRDERLTLSNIAEKFLNRDDSFSTKLFTLALIDTLESLRTVRNMSGNDKDSNDKKRTLLSFFQPLSSSSPSGLSQQRANSSTSTPGSANTSSTRTSNASASSKKAEEKKGKEPSTSKVSTSLPLYMQGLELAGVHCYTLKLVLQESQLTIRI